MSDHATRLVFLIDGNNLGHVLGLFDKAQARYDQAGLVSLLDGLARHLAAQGQEAEIVLFIDDIYAFERTGAWWVRLVPVPGGDADAAIRAYAQAHAKRLQILVSGDQGLQGDVSVWGLVSLAPQDFIARYLKPARQAGYVAPAAFVAGELNTQWPSTKKTPAAPQTEIIRQHSTQAKAAQTAALARTQAALGGQSVPPKAYRLDLSRWPDEAELSLYLLEHHLCPQHPELTTPSELIMAIRTHCSRQPNYFSSGPIVQRLFRLFLCRPEHTLSLDHLSVLADTRRRKVKAALVEKGEKLGIAPVW